MNYASAMLLVMAACNGSSSHTPDAPGNGSGSNTGGACTLTVSGRVVRS